MGDIGIVLLAGVPSGPDMAAAIIIAGVNALLGAVGGIVDSFHWLMLSLPAPGEATKPATWFRGVHPLLSNGIVGIVGSGSGTGAGGSPGAGAGPPIPLDVRAWWGVTWSIYGVLAGVVILPVGVSAVVAWSRSDVTPRETGERLRTAGKSLGLVLAGPVLIPVALHLGDLFAVGMAPSGTEFLSTPDSVAKLKIGVALAVVFAAFEAMVFLVALFVVFAQWIAVFFVVALWPAFIAALASNNWHVRSFGEAGVTALLGLIALKGVQAIWLRFLFALPLDFSATGSLLTVLAVVLGVSLGFIGLPIKGTEKVLPQRVSSAWRRSARNADTVISRRTGD